MFYGIFSVVVWRSFYKKSFRNCFFLKNKSICKAAVVTCSKAFRYLFCFPTLAGNNIMKKKDQYEQYRF
jgi:hypothetical protein